MKSNYSWTLLFIAGLLLIVLGLYVISNPLHAYMWMVRYVGFPVLANGLFVLFVCYRIQDHPRESVCLGIEGIIDILFAAMLLFNPFFSFVLFPVLAGPWMISKGILKFVGAFRFLQPAAGGMFILLFGACSIVMGLLLLFYPLDRAAGATLLVGGFAIMMGSFYLFDAVRYRNKPDVLEMVF